MFAAMASTVEQAEVDPSPLHRASDRVARLPAGTRDELAERRERQLFLRCRAGDEEARTQLVERFMPLARSVAKRYERSTESIEDLMQVACLGLVNAVDRFEPERGARFSTFAVPTILGELKRYFRDHTWVVHVPRTLNELSLRVDRAATALELRLGRAPTISELATEADVSVEEVLEAREVGRSRRIRSLDAPVAAMDGAATVSDTLVSARADAERELAEKRLVLEPLMATLPDRQQEILRMRYEHDLTQQQIADQIGVSQMQISRIIRQALDRLNEVARSPRAAW
jgi:RNA polymerase sigma-B factor